MSNPSVNLVNMALHRTTSAYRPSTVAAHQSHIKTYTGFLIYMRLPMNVSVHCLLAFMEYLHDNSLSPSVIKNYISSLTKQAKRFGWEMEPFSHHLVRDYIRSITINSSFAPSHKGVFDLPTLARISEACSSLYDPPLFRAAFLLAYFGFLRMSNIAPHSLKAFDSTRHLLHQDIIFASPGAPCAPQMDKNYVKSN